MHIMAVRGYLFRYQGKSTDRRTKCKRAFSSGEYSQAHALSRLFARNVLLLFTGICISSYSFNFYVIHRHTLINWQSTELNNILIEL